MFFLSPAALGTDVADYAGVAADGITVYRVVDGAVAYAAFLHAADNLLEGVKVAEGVAVKLYVADVPCVGEGVVGSLQLYLGESVDVVVYGDVEGIGVVFTVGDALYLAEALLVLSDKVPESPSAGVARREKFIPVFLLSSSMRCLILVIMRSPSSCASLLSPW